MNTPADSAAIPLPVAQRAVEWLVELQAAEASAATRAAWQQWRAQHPDHERAWQRIEAVNGRLRGVASPLASGVARTALAPAHSLQRREAVKILALLVCAGGGIWALPERAPWRGWPADISTGVGERRRLTLADGSSVALNTDSAIDVRFDPRQRRLRLLAGEIMITTARDAQARPFLVATAQGELRPLGTRFAVRQYAASDRVDVFEGAVEIRPRAAPAQILRAGEQAYFDAAGSGPAAALNSADSAWIDGMIVASGMRLQDFLAELSRYRRGRLSCDAAVADLRVSGTYPLADTDRILDTLRATLPVEIQFRTRYWATVRPARA